MDVSYLLYPIFYKWGHSLNVRKFASLMSNIKKLLFLLRTIRINLRCLPGLRWIAQIFLWNVPILHDACISLRYHSVLMVFYWVPEREDGNELRKKGQSYTHLWYGYTQDINITERLPLQYNLIHLGEDHIPEPSFTHLKTDSFCIFSGSLFKCSLIWFYFKFKHDSNSISNSNTFCWRLVCL